MGKFPDKQVSTGEMLNFKDFSASDKDLSDKIIESRGTESAVMTRASCHGDKVNNGSLACQTREEL